MQQFFLNQLEQRFVRYVQIDTQSDEKGTAVPSTAKQLDLLRLLADEMRTLGVEDVLLTNYACVMGTIPATIPANDIPTVAFLAHVDTARPHSTARPLNPSFTATTTAVPLPCPTTPPRS